MVPWRIPRYCPFKGISTESLPSRSGKRTSSGQGSKKASRRGSSKPFKMDSMDAFMYTSPHTRLISPNGLLYSSSVVTATSCVGSSKTPRGSAKASANSCRALSGSAIAIRIARRRRNELANRIHDSTFPSNNKSKRENSGV